ncbi:dethiobiotin synthase [Natronobiforma cellulositropha]|uniref:dethiobiotin synthase n=1 Tax=Natronobiforma cellulositropha TaxID=1679076 RepID=UPI0021D56C1B|nr:dethiobiotin synthase [Natronobiforma cellulositropha]
MAVRVAVVGTDTGVGKTVVTAGLTALLRRQGVDARAVKPAQTGHPPDDDAAYVRRVCESVDAATCPRYLEPPLAPSVAAELAGETLTYESLRETCDRELARGEVGVLEGVGGLRVPLAEDREVIDLVSELGCETILVARAGLGTLNHTALSVEALERRGVDVRAIVLNEYRGASRAERTNPAELERMTGVTVATVPPLDVDTADEVVDAVRSALGSTARAYVGQVGGDGHTGGVG